MAGTVVADNIQAASTSTLVLKNGVANTPPTIQDSAGTEIGTFCRAWVNFNGTGAVAIRSDFNVVDITDNGIGDYTVNIDVDMPDANYAWAVSAGRTSSLANNAAMATSAPTAGALRFGTTNVSFAATDMDYVTVSIFR